MGLEVSYIKHVPILFFFERRLVLHHLSSNPICQSQLKALCHLNIEVFLLLPRKVEYTTLAVILLHLKLLLLPLLAWKSNIFDQQKTRNANGKSVKYIPIGQRVLEAAIGNQKTASAVKSSKKLRERLKFLNFQCHCPHLRSFRQI